MLESAAAFAAMTERPELAAFASERAVNHPVRPATCKKPPE
jgi:hypothetical protein